MLPSFYICRDQREHENHGWVFDAEEKQPSKPQILGTKDLSTDAGDYFIENAPDLVRCERKNGFAELFGNFSPKEHKERFIREMEKLSVVKFKYLIIETVLSQDSLCLSVPQFSFGHAPPCKRIVEWIYLLQREYGIIPIFAGDAGKTIAKGLFKEIARKYL